MIGLDMLALLLVEPIRGLPHLLRPQRLALSPGDAGDCSYAREGLTISFDTGFFPFWASFRIRRPNIMMAMPMIQTTPT